MEAWKREFWEEAGFPDPDSLIGKRFRFEFNRSGAGAGLLKRSGITCDKITGTVVSHEVKWRSDAHCEYVRLYLRIEIDSAQGPLAAHAELTYDLGGSERWVFNNGREGQDKPFHDFLPGTLAIDP